MEDIVRKIKTLLKTMPPNEAIKTLTKEEKLKLEALVTDIKLAEVINAALQKE